MNYGSGLLLGAPAGAVVTQATQVWSDAVYRPAPDPQIKIPPVTTAAVFGGPGTLILRGPLAQAVMIVPDTPPKFFQPRQMIAAISYVPPPAGTGGGQYPHIQAGIVSAT